MDACVAPYLLVVVTTGSEHGVHISFSIFYLFSALSLQRASRCGEQGLLSRSAPQGCSLQGLCCGAQVIAAASKLRAGRRMNRSPYADFCPLVHLWKSCVSSASALLSLRSPDVEYCCTNSILVLRKWLFYFSLCCLCR